MTSSWPSSVRSISSAAGGERENSTRSGLSAVTEAVSFITVSVKGGMRILPPARRSGMPGSRIGISERFKTLPDPGSRAERGEMNG